MREIFTGRFISFPRGSNERTFLYPVLKTLLSLGEREMRVWLGVFVRIDSARRCFI